MGVIPEDISDAVWNGSYFKPKKREEETDVSDLLDRMRGGVFEQESSGNYQVRPNRRTGATGGFQVLPENIGPWTQKYLGKRLTREQFEADPQAQDAVFAGEMGNYLRKARAKAPDDDTALRMAAAAWYGGEGRMDRYDDPVRFRPDEPSFREYTEGVLAKSRPRFNAGQVADNFWQEQSFDPYAIADEIWKGGNQPSPTFPTAQPLRTGVEQLKETPVPEAMEKPIQEPKKFLRPGDTLAGSAGVSSPSPTKASQVALNPVKESTPPLATSPVGGAPAGVSGSAVPAPPLAGMPSPTPMLDQAEMLAKMATGVMNDPASVLAPPPMPVEQPAPEKPVSAKPKIKVQPRGSVVKESLPTPVKTESVPEPLVEQGPDIDEPPTSAANSEEPSTRVDASEPRVIDDSFSEKIGFSTKPKGVTNTDWFIKQLVPKIAERTGYDPADIEEELRASDFETLGNGLEAGSPLSEVSPEGYFEFKMSPELSDKLAARGIARTEIAARTDKANADFNERVKAIPADVTGADRELEAFRLKGLADVDAGLLKPEQAAAAYEKLKTNIDTWREDRGILGIWNEEEWAKLHHTLSAINQSNYSEKRSTQKDSMDVPSAKAFFDKAYADMIRQYKTVDNWVRAKKEFKERFQSSPMSLLLKTGDSAVGGAMKVPFQGAAAILETAAIGKEAVDRTVGTDEPEAEKKVIYKLGNDLRQLADGVKVDPAFKGGNAELAGNVFGQVVAQVTLGMLTGGAAAPTLFGASMGASDAFREADKGGASPWQKIGSALVGAALAAPDYLIFRNMLKAGSAVERAALLQNFKGTVERGLVEKGVEGIIANKAAASATDGLLKELIAKGGWKGSLGRGIEVAGQKSKVGLAEAGQEMSESSGNDLYAYLTYDPSPERWEAATGVTGKKLVEGAAGFFGGITGATLGEIHTRSMDLTPEAKTQAADLLEDFKADLPEETYENAKDALGVVKTEPKVNQETDKASLPTESIPTEELPGIPANSEVSPKAQNIDTKAVNGDAVDTSESPKTETQSPKDLIDETQTEVPEPAPPVESKDVVQTEEPAVDTESSVETTESAEKRKNEIATFVKVALARPDVSEKYVIANASNETRAKLETALGSPMSPRYRHVMTSEGIRHALKQHGNEAKESPRGQEAITEEDFGLIPEIVAEPDTVEKGKDTKTGLKTVVYSKRFNGTTFYVEAVRHGKQELATTTLYKRRAPKAPTPDARNVSPVKPERVDAASDAKAHDTTNAKPDGYINYRPVKVIGASSKGQKVRFLDTGVEKVVSGKAEKVPTRTNVSSFTGQEARTLFGLPDNDTDFGINPIETNENDDVLYSVPKYKGKRFEQRPVMIESLIQRDADLRTYIEKNSPEPNSRRPTPVVIGLKPGGGVVLDGLKRITQAVANGQRFINAYVEADEPSLLSIAGTNNPTSVAELKNLSETEDFREIVPKVVTSLEGNVLGLDTPEAVETFRTLLAFSRRKDRVRAPILEGAFLTPSNAQKVLEAASVFAETAEEAGIDAKPVREMIAKLDTALDLKRGVRVRVFENAAPHEAIHEGSFVGADGKPLAERYARSEELKDDPVFRKFHEELDKIQGPSSHDVAVEEALAYVGSGDYERFGLNEDEAVGLLAGLVERYAEKNGVESLANFEPDTKLYESINNYREKRSREKSDGSRSAVGNRRKARSDTSEEQSEEDDSDAEERERAQRTDLKAGDRVKDSYGRKGTVFADGTRSRLPITPAWEKTAQQKKFDRKAARDAKKSKRGDFLGDPDNDLPPDPWSSEYDDLADIEAHAMAMKNVRFSLETEPVAGYEKTKVSHEQVKKVYEEILNRLGRPTPIRTGRLGTKKARGIYKSNSEVIRLKEAGNIPTAAHEVFHAIQKVVFGEANSGALSKVPRPAMRELVELGKALYGKTRPNGGYGTEGFAEFGRYYLTRDDADKAAPKMFRYFEDEFLANNPDLAEALKDARKVTDAYRRQGALNRAESSMSRPTLKRKAENIIRNLRSNFTTLMVDELSPLLRFTKEVEKQGNVTLSAGQNPGMIASFLRGNAAPVVHYMATDGMIDAARNKVGPPLTDAFAIVRGKQWEFEQYLRARRSIERWRQDKNPGLSLEDAETIVKAYDSPEFQLAADAYYSWNRGVFNYVRGLVPDMAPLLDQVEEASYDYVPLMRDMTEDQQTLAGKYSGLGQNPIQRMKGSGRRIKPIFPQVIANAERLVSLAHKRKVLDSIARLEDIEGIGKLLERVPRDKVPMSVSIAEIEKALEDAGADLKDVDLEQAITFFMPAQAPKGQDPILPIMRDGQVVWYQVPADLYNSLSGMDLYRMGKVADFFLGAPARAFRLGSTGLRASFSLFTNPARDLQTLLMQSQSKNPAKLMLNYVSALKSAVNPKRAIGRNDPALDAFYRLGINLAQPLGVDEATTTKFANQLFMSMPRRVVSSPINMLRELLGVTESVPRVAEMATLGKEIGWKPGDTLTFDQAVKLGLAGKQVTTDFSAAGKVGKVFNQAVPFFNANVQGTRSFLRAFNRNPAGTALRGFLYITLPTLLLWWRNKDEEWYTDMPDREKHVYWNIEHDGQIIQIPRAQENGGVFATVPESIVDSWYRQDPEGFKASMGYIFELATPPVLPVPAKAAQEQWLNQIAFFDRPIVPRAEEDLPPSEQYGQYTSEVAKWIGKNLPDAKVLGIPINSPRRIDAAIRTFGGGVAADLVQITNTKKPEEWEPSDYPVIGRAFRRGGTFGTGSKAVDKFYDALEVARQRAASKEKPETEDEAVFRKQLEDASKALGTLRKAASGASKEQKLEMSQMGRDIARRAMNRLSPVEPEPTDTLAERVKEQNEASKRLTKYFPDQAIVGLAGDELRRDETIKDLEKVKGTSEFGRQLNQAVQDKIITKKLADRIQAGQSKQTIDLALAKEPSEVVKRFNAAIPSATPAVKKELVIVLREKFDAADSPQSKRRYLEALKSFIPEGEFTMREKSINAKR